MAWLYDLAFLTGFAIVAIRVAGDRRAFLWLLAGAASYAHALYIRLGGPHPLFAGVIFDALVFAAIYRLGKYEWELGLGRIFQVMMGANLIAFFVLDFCSATGDAASLLHNAYMLTLDLSNVAALAWIGINGDGKRLEEADEHVTFVAAPGRVRRALMALRRKRAHPPFWKVHS